MPNDDENRKKAEKPAAGAASQPGTASSGYSFFVDQPGNEGYNYGVSGAQPAGADSTAFSPPSWFNDMTSAPSYNYDVTTTTNSSPASAPSSYPPVKAPPDQTTPYANYTPPQQPESSVSTDSAVAPAVPEPAPYVNYSSPRPIESSPAYSSAPVPMPAVTLPVRSPQLPGAQPQAQPQIQPESLQVFEQKEQKEYLSLNLAADRRFANLHLTRELSDTVDRIYSLVDLDFNGFVDFSELNRVLTGEHLSESEQAFVKLIYALACKVLMERPTLENYYVPVLSKEDFRLAFAYQCASVLGPDAQSKGILTRTTKEYKASLFADNDDPLASLKPAAVKLGAFGDAYFAAGLASLVQMRPRAILRMLRVTADKSYQVNFGLYDKPVDVMPPRPEAIGHYGLADQFGFWFPLLEKAYGVNLAQKHKLASKLADHRNESFSRASQVFEVLSGALAETVVLANLNSLDLLAYLTGLVEFQRAAIVVAADNIPAGQTYAMPMAGKPYPFLSVDKNLGTVCLGTIYSENRDLVDGAVIRYSMDDFRRYFKVIYCEHSSQTNNSSTENPWKKMSRGPKLR